MPPRAGRLTPWKIIMTVATSPRIALPAMPGLSFGGALLVAVIGFLTLVDLFATQAILPPLAIDYGV